MMDLSATNNTPVDEHETMIVVEELTKARVEAAMTGCPPMGGQLIEAVDAFGVTLEDPTVQGTKIRDRSIPPPEATRGGF